MRLWSGYARHIFLVTGLFPLAVNKFEQGQRSWWMYTHTLWLNWESERSRQPAVVREWSTHRQNTQNNLWPGFCAHPTGMEEAVVCSSQWSSDGRPGRVGVLQK